jgi:hypothetical protein
MVYIYNSSGLTVSKEHMVRSPVGEISSEVEKPERVRIRIRIHIRQG